MAVRIVRRCPVCGSADIRRSSVRTSEVGSHAFRSPYRCRACSERFWVISHRTRVGAAVATTFILAAAAIAVGATLFPRYASQLVNSAKPRDNADFEEWSPGAARETVSGLERDAPSGSDSSGR